MGEINKSNEKRNGVTPIKKVSRKNLNKVAKEKTVRNAKASKKVKENAVKKQIVKKTNNLPKEIKKENLEPIITRIENKAPAVIKKKNNSIIDLGLQEKAVAIKDDFIFKKENLKIIPLGGIEEIGKNITVFEYGNDIVVVDCGVAFPEDDMLGIDLVIPDFSYLEKNKDKIRGLVITHGHEDHIGAIAYLLKQINIPIYATKLTCGLIQNKLQEHHLEKVAKLYCKTRANCSIWKNESRVYKKLS